MKTETILSLFNADYTYIERPSPEYIRYTSNLSICIFTKKTEKIIR